MDTSISILAEIPEDLHISLKGYLNQNPDWDQDRVFSAALSLFLLQNTPENTPESSQNYRRAARVYLETLFRSHDAVSEKVSSSQTEVSAGRSADLSPDSVIRSDDPELAMLGNTSTVLPTMQTEQSLTETLHTTTDLVSADFTDAPTAQPNSLSPIETEAESSSIAEQSAA